MFAGLVATQVDGWAAGFTTRSVHAKAPAPQGTPQGVARDAPGGVPGPRPGVVALGYDCDIEDERFLVALSDNVFAGRVERVSGAATSKASNVLTLPPKDTARPPPLPAFPF